jgi:hypothetical protein
MLDQPYLMDAIQSSTFLQSLCLGMACKQCMGLSTCVEVRCVWVLHVYIYIYIYVYAYVFMHIYIYMYVCIYSQICVHVHVYAYVHTRRQTYRRLFGGTGCQEIWQCFRASVRSVLCVYIRTYAMCTCMCKATHFTSSAVTFARHLVAPIWTSAPEESASNEIRTFLYLFMYVCISICRCSSAPDKSATIALHKFLCKVCTYVHNVHLAVY